jgi:hypothetical protein
MLFYLLFMLAKHFVKDYLNTTYREGQIALLPLRYVKMLLLVSVRMLFC